MSSGFNLTNQSQYIKIFNDGQKSEKKQHRKQESVDKPPRVSPGKQKGLKYILVAVDVVQVLVRYAPKQHCLPFFFQENNHFFVNPDKMP